ncbi:MAG: hypothetical protein DI535_01595 [Citrobacter freundii]|nr:MAG: hypothetical protein DI535_01595 [Citrobacter freundii]
MRTFYIIAILLLSWHEVKADKPGLDKHVNLRAKDAIDNFWHWFTKNENRLKKFETDPARYLNEFLTQIKKIRTGLAVELEPPKNGIINMTISADGNIELFHIVEQIVTKAPTVKGWKIFAFRQRLPLASIKDISVRVGDVQLDPSKMKFLPVIENGKLNVVIYVAGVNEDNYDKIAYAGLMLLDNILGEYDCVMKVDSYDFKELPDKNKTGAVPRPLLELPAFVDEFHGK